MDLRHYFKVTRRSLFAIRLYGFRADGNLPDVLAFGGIDTLRTFPVYGIVGNGGVPEHRVPLPAHRPARDAGARHPGDPRQGLHRRRRREAQEPALAVLGRYTLCGNGNTVFGGAPAGCNGAQGGYSDWGFGFQTNFLGLPLHFDVARQWNFKQQLTDFKLFFYLGQEF